LKIESLVVETLEDEFQVEVTEKDDEKGLGDEERERGKEEGGDDDEEECNRW